MKNHVGFLMLFAAVAPETNRIVSNSLQCFLMHSFNHRIGPLFSVSSSLFETMNMMVKKGSTITMHVSSLHLRFVFFSSTKLTVSV